MLTVHHLSLSQSERIVWLCEELKIPYELRRYERDAITGEAPPEYQALHPVQLAPIISDGALTLAESGAIVEYLLAKYGGGRLTIVVSRPNFTDYLFWFHFANATMMPSEQAVAIASLLASKRENKVVDLLVGRSDRMFALVERRLREATFFSGEEFTAADIMMLFPLTTLRKLALLRGFPKRDLAGFPYTRRYLERIGERPAYQGAMAKADPDDPPLLR